MKQEKRDAGNDAGAFGAELRRLRGAADMSLQRLAEATFFSKSHLSKVENGRKAPSIDLARACDAALGAGGRLSGLVEAPGGRRGAAASARAFAPEAIPRPAESRGLPVGAGLGAFSIGSDALLGRSASGREREPALVSEHVLTSFRILFDQLRVLGQQSSPAIVLPTVMAQTQALQQLAKGAGPKLVPPALMLASRYAEFGGWMAQEAGEERTALWWTDRALELATAAGDGQLHAHALVRRACIAMYAHDGLQTIELAQRAQAAATASPRVRAMAAEREAQGHALVGDYDTCRRTLARAAALAEADPGDSEAGAGGTDDAPPLGSSTVLDRHSVVTGWCLYDVGRPAEAAAVLAPAVKKIPATAVRARTRFGMRLALAHAGSNNIDRACDLTHELLDGAEAIDSATVAHDVRQLSRTLARWHTAPSVRTLTPRLARALNRTPL
ncbi:helix-turn-helix domain-containing protein [Nocardiopsis mangrovi]|uniref:Helix-turn-helix domain-containing protein n=1 Tax=Nocardiopsis mangrovi TaxID=1179818 RepID=A0ABV9DY13_9ACTN